MKISLISYVLEWNRKSLSFWKLKTSSIVPCSILSPFYGCSRIKTFIILLFLFWEKGDTITMIYGISHSIIMICWLQERQLILEMAVNKVLSLLYLNTSLTTQAGPIFLLTKLNQLSETFSSSNLIINFWWVQL